MSMYASDMEEILREKAGKLKLEIQQTETAIQVINNLDTYTLNKPLKALSNRLLVAKHEQVCYGVAIQALIAFRAKWKGYKSWECANTKTFELDRIKEDLTIALAGMK